ncbi:hypothetical protein R1T16_12375 [Flavobacterium sp. DG1-102-2]|uniref:hypothetical protein n=1 Tax=Flavobacterium sp. DG1-102-2 TaxID=3081663 RepID=UPI002949FDFE|nr:hypothetical protein [Flavobacterium sp. DG1-102-2]MDV6169223.1 hypothetical protein [Flavobacterium sp. DG1-102-2]
MKKRLEAELISIAHRILKLKNRAELDQLQQETLKLYEKIAVLRFVEDNFSDVKPTIGHASAEETLEEIYGLEEEPVVHANEVEAKEEKAREEKKAEQEKKAEAEPKQEAIEKETADESGEGVAAEKEEAPVSEKEIEETEEQSDEELPAEEEEGDPKPEDAEEEPAVEEAKEEAETEKKQTEVEEESTPEPKEEEKVEEPATKIEVEKPEEELKAMEEAAAAVFKKEDESSIEEEEKAADAEIITIAPDPKTKVEDSGLRFDYAFERPAAQEEPAKQKEITFEDYKDYKEPEFVKKEDANSPKQAEPVKEELKQEYRDWRDWEPSKSAEAEPAKEETKSAPVAEQPKQEAPKEEPKQESSVRGNIATRSDFERPKSLNDSLGKSISLGLNDRIAFEKNLFSGSTDDLNRVLSQLNTINTYDEAKGFIENLVKPDYNNWDGKEEYEERFMAIVEKKFN